MGWDTRRLCLRCLSSLDAAHQHPGDEGSLGGYFARPARLAVQERAAEQSNLPARRDTSGPLWKHIISGSCQAATLSKLDDIS